MEPNEYFFKEKYLIDAMNKHANAVNKTPAQFDQKDIYTIVYEVYTSKVINSYYNSQEATEEAIHYLLNMDSSRKVPVLNKM